MAEVKVAGVTEVVAMAEVRVVGVTEVVAMAVVKVAEMRAAVAMAEVRAVGVMRLGPPDCKPKWKQSGLQAECTKNTAELGRVGHSRVLRNLRSKLIGSAHPRQHLRSQHSPREGARAVDTLGGECRERASRQPATAALATHRNSIIRNAAFSLLFDRPRTVTRYDTCTSRYNCGYCRCAPSNRTAAQCRAPPAPLLQQPPRTEHAPTTLSSASPASTPPREGVNEGVHCPLKAQ